MRRIRSALRPFISDLDEDAGDAPGPGPESVTALDVFDEGWRLEEALDWAAVRSRETPEAEPPEDSAACGAGHFGELRNPAARGPPSASPLSADLSGPAQGKSDEQSAAHSARPGEAEEAVAAQGKAGGGVRTPRARRSRPREGEGEGTARGIPKRARAAPGSAQAQSSTGCLSPSGWSASLAARPLSAEVPGGPSRSRVAAAGARVICSPRAGVPANDRTEAAPGAKAPDALSGGGGGYYGGDGVGNGGGGSSGQCDGGGSGALLESRCLFSDYAYIIVYVSNYCCPPHPTPSHHRDHPLIHPLFFCCRMGAWGALRNLSGGPETAREERVTEKKGKRRRQTDTCLCLPPRHKSCACAPRALARPARSRVRGYITNSL